MKKLLLFLAAGLLVLFSAQGAKAAYLYADEDNITNHGDYAMGETISPIESTVVAIKAPMAPIKSEPFVWYKAGEGYINTEGRFFLDPGKLWSANDLTGTVPFEATPFKVQAQEETPLTVFEADVTHQPRYYCLDTISRVCDPNLYRY